MKKRLFVFPLVMAVALLQACGGNNTPNKEDSVDSARKANSSQPAVHTDASNFATKAASGGMLEVQLGQMAQQKAISQRVKDFGLMMIRDHTKGNDELKTIAGQKSVTLPQTLSDDHQKMMDKLSKKEGNDFDKDYISMMVDDHKEDIDEYTKAAANLSDAELKAYAKNTVPTLQMHLDSAKAIEAGLKK